MNIALCTPYEALLKGLEGVTDQQEFCQKSTRFLDDVFERILAILAIAPTIAWHRTAKGLEGEREAYAQILVKNYADEEITLPVVLYIRTGRRDQIALLHLGGKSGPSKNDDDQRVRELATRVFGEYH